MEGRRSRGAKNKGMKNENNVRYFAVCKNYLCVTVMIVLFSLFFHDAFVIAKRAKCSLH